MSQFIKSYTETIGTIIKAKSMRDKISLDRATLLHPAVRQEVIDCIEKVEAGFPDTIMIRIVQGLRTIEQQDAIYAQGRTTPGEIVTKAKGGHSYHNYGLAIDFALIYNGKELSWDTAKDGDKDGVKDWMEVIEVFKNKGWKWGNSWGDAPHLEKAFGHSIADLLNRYHTGNFIPGTKYVQIA